MTRIWSASRTVDSRWAMTMEVRPASTFLSARCTATSDSESRWAVASSSTTTSGALRSRRAMATRCFSPPDKPVAPVPHQGVEAVGQRCHHVQDLGVPQGVHELVVGGVGPGIEQVGPDGVVEKVGVLGHHPDHVLQRAQGDVPHVRPIYRDRTPGHVVKAGGQVADGGLARARRPDQGHQLARLGHEGNVEEDLLAAGCARDRHRLERGQRNLLGRG